MSDVARIVKESGIVDTDLMDRVFGGTAQLLNCALLRFRLPDFRSCRQNLLAFSRCRAAPPSGSYPHCAKEDFPMAYTIAVAGKGGVGKTTICGMMIDVPRREAARVRCWLWTRMPIPI